MGVGARAHDVEGVRVLIDLGIPVGGADQRDHQLALPHRFPLELDRFEGDAAGALHRGIPAERFLDRLGRQPVRVGAQRLPLRGVAEQGQHGVADQVDGGLEPGDEQENAHRQHLTRLDLVALDRDQAADDVLPRFTPSQLEEVLEELGQFLVASLQLPCVTHRLDAVQRAADDHAVAGEVRGTGVRDAEQVGDHRDRQRRGEAGDQIEPARRAGPVQQIADRVLDLAGVARHRLRAERGQRELAQPGMVRRVHAEEGHVGGVRFGRLAVILGADAEAPVTQHRVAHPVAGAHPATQAGRGQRAALAQPVVDRIRIHPSRAQLEQRHRISLDVTGAGDARPLAVEPGREGDRLPELAQGWSVRVSGEPGEGPVPCRNVLRVNWGASRGARCPDWTDSAAT